MSDLEASLRSALPAELDDAVLPLAQLLSAVISGHLGPATAQERISADEGLKTALKALSGQRVKAGGNVVSFEGANTGDVNIGVVAGRDAFTINHNVQQLPTPSPALFQLRAPTGDFVGREKEIAQLVDALSKATTSGAAAAISGVRGMGGIGKSELALKVAHELRELFPDGQLLIELRGASSSPLTPELVLQTAIRAFEREAKLPEDLSQLQGLYRSLLSGKRVLVLADDAKDAAQIRSLMPPAGCALLVTSRNKFNLPGMVGLDLGALPPEEAEALLLSLCPRIANYASEIARLCGYLPLALRVSAGLLANSNRQVERYAEQLATRRLERLADLDNPGDPSASVGTSLRLSYDALETTAQSAVCQLSVFSASFDLPAAKAIVEIEGEIEEVLDVLVRRCLLEGDESSGRYSQHELLRAFATMYINDSYPLYLRYARYYLEVSNRIKFRIIKKNDLLGALALFDQERRHIDAAWSWAMREAGKPEVDDLLLHFYPALFLVSELRYDVFRERIPQLEAQFAAARRLGRKNKLAFALGDLGVIYDNLGYSQKAVEFFEQQLIINREIHTLSGELFSLRRLGNAYRNLGNSRKAFSLLDQALDLARQKGARQGEAYCLGGIGTVYNDLGFPHKAIEFFEQQLAITRAINDSRGTAYALGGLGNAYLALGDLHTAIQFFEQQLASQNASSNFRAQAFALGGLGRAYLTLGDPHTAIKLYEQQLTLARTISDFRSEAYALGGLGRGYYDLGDAHKAIEFYEQALEIFDNVADDMGYIRTSWELGLVLEQQDDLDRASSLMQMWVKYLQEIGHANAEAHATHFEQLCQRLAAQDRKTSAGTPPPEE